MPSPYMALYGVGVPIAEALLAQLPHHLPRVASRSSDSWLDSEFIADHVCAYAAAMVARSPALWQHHLGWANALMMARGWSRHEVQLFFSLMRDHIAQHAGEAACEVFDSGLQALPRLPSQITCEPNPRLPHQELSQSYLDALLNLDKAAARHLVHEAKLPLTELYQFVIGPAMYRVGALWQAGRITPAQEHICTAMTAEIMTELRNGRKPRPNGRRVVAASVAGERHDLGIRMVSDIFEFRGWVSLYLGADVPTDSLVTVVMDYDADVLAVSVSMTSKLVEVHHLADLLRRANARSRLLVGGLPFQLAPAVYEVLGADATAPDPSAAVQVASAILMK